MTTPLWLAVRRLRTHAESGQMCVYVYTGDLLELFQEYDERGAVLDGLRPYFAEGGPRA